MKKSLLKYFEYEEKIVIGAFLIKLTQVKKIGSVGKLLTPLGNLNIQILFQNRSRSCFSGILRFSVK